MIEDYGVVLNKINSRNLFINGLKLSELEERRIIEIYEMADEIAGLLGDYVSVMSFDEMLTFISENLNFTGMKIHDDALEFNYVRLRSFLDSVHRIDKALFSELLIERFCHYYRNIDEKDFLSETCGDESFTYLKNPFSDEAYDVFSEAFDDPRIKYSKTLKEAAQLASDGIITYALLPLEEGGGQRLHSVAKLIFDLDLKINSVTPVYGLDGSADMKYALVSHGFTIPSVRDGDDLYLEIRLSNDSDLLGDILSVAKFFGCDVYRIGSLRFGEEDNERFYSIVFKSFSGTFVGLLTYLTLFINSYTPVGIYKNLE